MRRRGRSRIRIRFTVAEARSSPKGKAVRKRKTPAGRNRRGGLWTPATRPGYDGPLLLDTHMWVSMLQGDTSRMSPRTVPLIERASASRQLYVSDISFWEVAVTTAKGKLALALEPAIWLRQAENAPGISYLPLDRTALILSTRLEGEIHADPADRILIASAQLHGMSLVTVDRLIIDYARARRGVPVCDASR